MPTDTKTEYIDEWLTTHMSYLPGDVIDFALDVRRLIAELEEELASHDRPEPLEQDDQTDEPRQADPVS